MSMTTSTSTSATTAGSTGTAGRTWVAFGSTGALASVHSHDGGYEVRPLHRGVVSGTYPTLEIAKAALRAGQDDDLEFTAH